MPLRMTPDTTPRYAGSGEYGAGYRRGFSEGHFAGEELGEQALRDRLLKRLEIWGHDLRLGLHDVATPEECLHQIELLIEDR